MSVDELDVNPFFIALQTLYQDKYEKAQEKCYLICIPQTSSIQDIVLTPKFVDCHILRPSPYFQGEYLTTYSSSKISVTYEVGCNALVVAGAAQGSNEGETIRIVNEELAYNKDQKKFKILVIERPIDTSFKLRNTKPAPTDETAPLPVTASFFECREFLKSNRLCEQAMKELDRSIILFLNNHIVLANYLRDTNSCLQQMCSTALEACMKVKEVQKNPQLKDCLPWVLESYVQGTVHHKVFPVLCEKLAEEDALLERRCRLIAGVDAKQIGIRPEFSCPMPLAVRELSRLNELQTPREKMLCLKTTIDNITESVSDHWAKESLHLKELSPQCEIVEPHLTCDDLLPILVSVIAQTRCQHLESHVFYTDLFNSFSDATDRNNLSYCLVTFKAAMEYMKSADFADVKPSEGASSEIEEEGAGSLAEDKAGKEAGPAQTGVLDRHSDPLNPSLIRMRRQLENISLMTREGVLQEKSNPPILSIFPGASAASYRSVPAKKDSEQKSNQLGDFLASLDDFDVAFGKQT